MAALSTIAALAAIASSAVSVGSALSGQSSSTPRPGPAMAPAGPDTSALVKEQSAAIAKRRRGAPVSGGAASGQASTLLTGASGLSSPASTERKTLLGL